MSNQESEQQLSEFKTTCCNADWYRKGRANYRCVECDKDVTLEVFYMMQSLPLVIKEHGYEPKDNNEDGDIENTLY